MYLSFFRDYLYKFFRYDPEKSIMINSIYVTLSGIMVLVFSKGLIAFYYFIEGLKESKLLDKILDFITPILDGCVAMSRDCTPLIMDLHRLYKCIVDNNFIK